MERGRQEGQREMANRWWTHLKTSLKCKDVWQELSGSLGDIGTFIPIVIALTLVNGLDLGTTLIFTGLYNILSGILFGVPMPVQPMKAIAAVAVTESNPLTVPQIMAGGLCTAMVLFLLGITRLIGVMDRLVPLPVVRGIQLSQGLKFSVTAVGYILREQNFASWKVQGKRPWLGFDSKLLALLAFCFVVLVSGSGSDHDYESSMAQRRGFVTGRSDDSEEAAKAEDKQQVCSRRWLVAVPSALLVFFLGIVLAFIRKPHIFKELKLGPSVPRLVRISREDWKVGFTRAAVPQLPLSILNSVFAVCKLSNDLFPNKPLVSPVRVSVSVGAMNLAGCWLGVLPVCHGAGGLAGQYRFGARNGVSVVFLGVGKSVIGLLLGSSLLQMLAQFPIALLGVLLLFSGIELAMSCRDQTSRMESFVMLTCAVVSQTSGLGLGCICGIILYFALYLRGLEYAMWRQRLVDSMRRVFLNRSDAVDDQPCPDA